MRFCRRLSFFAKIFSRRRHFWPARRFGPTASWRRAVSASAGLLRRCACRNPGTQTADPRCNPVQDILANDRADRTVNRIGRSSEIRGALLSVAIAPPHATGIAFQALAGRVLNSGVSIDSLQRSCQVHIPPRVTRYDRSRRVQSRGSVSSRRMAGQTCDGQPFL